jgi:NADPH-dependent ferric siderophore reductase
VPSLLDATVLAVTTPTPRLRRVRLACPGLCDGKPVRLASWVRLYVPELAESGRLAAGSRELPGFAPRSYTITAWDPATGQLTLDLVLHGEGPAARWAETVATGDTCRLAGPLGRFELDPARTRWLMVGDTTALPAIREILLALPPHAAAHAIIEAPASERQELTSPARLTVEWVEPDAAVGAASPLVRRAEARLIPEGWDSGDPALAVWLAAEARDVTALRAHLAAEGIGRAALTSSGYWRRGQAG